MQKVAKPRKKPETRGRHKLPEEKKIGNNMLYLYQWKRIQAEAKAVNIEGAQMLRNIVDWHFDQLDARRNGSAATKEDDTNFDKLISESK